MGKGDIFDVKNVFVGVIVAAEVIVLVAILLYGRGRYAKVRIKVRDR